MKVSCFLGWTAVCLTTLQLAGIAQQLPKTPQTAALPACEQSIRNANATLEKLPGDPDAQLQLARVLAGCQEAANAAASYRKYLEARPYAYRIWYELGETLLHEHKNSEAAAAFKTVLDLEPEDTGGELGLARSLSAQGRFREALSFYNQVIEKQPSNYDALQGKAFVLHWTRQDAEARLIFERLVEMNPHDEENRAALRAIARNTDEMRWEALFPRLRPSPRLAQVSYYISFLADHPHDLDAMRKLASAETELGYYSGAIHTYCRILGLNPADEEAWAQLAQVFAWDRQDDAAIGVFQGLLDCSPGNVEWMNSLARIYTWAGRFEDALALERKLSALNPANIFYSQQVVRLELRLKRNQAARQSLTDLLQRHPHNRWACLKLAALDLQEGRLKDALNNYDVVLGANFMDVNALYGEARVDYYLGRMDRAYPMAKNLVSERPNDFDALMLLARIERARQNPEVALTLAKRALRLKPDDAEVTELADNIRSKQEQPPSTLHTSASYARELGFASFIDVPYGFVTPRRPVEDLNSYSEGARISFSFLPQSQSYLAFSSMPSNSPVGGPTRGAVAPAEWLYGQTTEVTKSLVLRGGVGLTRLGPGDSLSPFKTLAVAPIGFVGYSCFPLPKLSLDFMVSRMSIPYTPTSVRFGVMETRITVGTNYAFDSRTHLRIEYDDRRVSSSVYLDSFTAGLEKNGHDQGNEVSVDFGRTLIRSNHFSLAAGYSGHALGYAGKRRGVWMGFFNPAFYQYHALALGFRGRLRGPVSYTLMTDLGVQQANEGEPFTRAIKLAPGLRFRVSPQLAITLGYVHYNFDESLGSVRGNAVELSTDWGF